MKTGALILTSGPMTKSDAVDNVVSAVLRLMGTFRWAGVEPVVVVTSASTPALRSHAARMGAICLQSGGTEMLDEVKVGLTFLADKCDQVLLTPADVPLFSTKTIALLLASGANAGIPVQNGQPGHPLLLSAKLFPVILAYKGDGGVTGALRESGYQRQQVDVEDDGVLQKISNAPVELPPQPLHPEIKLRIVAGQPFFGPGSARLLSLIGSTGSVRLACTQMDMSYSKGWKILGKIESQLGYTVVARQQGGKHGGAAVLTDKGRQLLERYTRYEQECKAAITSLFAQHFGDF